VHLLSLFVGTGQPYYGVRVRGLDKPAAFADRLRRFAYRYAYDQARTEAAEREKFRQLDFDVDRAYQAVDGVLADLGKPSFSSQRGMASMHWVLFACVAQRFEVRRILEIGTYDGETTLLLSRLFPAADITTLSTCRKTIRFSLSPTRGRILRSARRSSSGRPGTPPGRISSWSRRTASFSRIWRCSHST
jgi:hypothetical protein